MPGLALIDRFTDQGNAIDGHLKDKFMIGVTDMRFSKEMRLENIVGFHYSAVGQSHFPSIIDVALGSLRFAVNAHTQGDHKKEETSRALLEMLAPIFWREEGDTKVSDLGLALRPMTRKVATYDSLMFAVSSCRREKSLLPISSFFSTAATGKGRKHDHETTVDHALIRGLVTAGPVMRRGASSV